MNYQEARKLEDGSGWHMTVRNDDRIWTHSCCRDPGPPATDEDVEKYGYKLGEPTLGKPHAPHATREEAEDCYHEWRLRQIRETVEFSDEVFGDWQGCKAPGAHSRYHGEDRAVCDTPTKGGARYRDDHHPEHVALCPDHRSIDVVLALVQRSTGSIYS